MTATFWGFYYRVLSFRASGGKEEGCTATSQESLPPHPASQIRYMINIQCHMGSWGTTGSVFPELDGRREWRSNVIQILPKKKKRKTKAWVCINTPLGILPLICETVDAGVSKRSLQRTPLLAGKSRTKADSPREGAVCWVHIISRLSRLQVKDSFVDVDCKSSPHAEQSDMLMRRRTDKLSYQPVTLIKSSDGATWPAVRTLSHSVLPLAGETTVTEPKVPINARTYFSADIMSAVVMLCAFFFYIKGSEL